MFIINVNDVLARIVYSVIVLKQFSIPGNTYALLGIQKTTRPALPVSLASWHLEKFQEFLAIKDQQRLNTDHQEREAENSERKDCMR